MKRTKGSSMSDQRDDMNYGEKLWRRGSPQGPAGPHEYPALDDGPGYWAGRWSEFKRLFVLLAWRNEQTRLILVLGSAIFILTLLWGLIFT